jgi:multidrug efflux pump subunit AcrB
MVAWFARHRTAANLFMAAIMILGLKRETLPEIQNDQVQIQVIYRGATPEQVEVPVVTELGRTEAVIALAVTGTADALDLKTYAEDLRDRLLAGTDVAEVTVGGFSDRHIRIEVPAWRPHRYGLSAGDIADAVARQSVGMPGGRLEGAAEDLLLRFDDQCKRAEDFRDLVVVSGSAGAALRLGDIATVDDTFRERQPEGQDLVQSVIAVLGENPDAFETGSHVARVVVNLLGAKVRDAKLADVLNVWRDAVGEQPDVIAVKFTEPAIGPGGRRIDLRLVGKDLGRLKAAAGELMDYLNGFTGVQDLTDDLRPGKRGYRIRLKPDAGVLGLDAQTLARQPAAAFQGVNIDEFPVGTETYEVNLRVDPADRAGPESLTTFTVRGRDGALIPLATVAEIEPTRGWVRIQRIDGQRAITIQGNVDRDLADAQELLGLARAELIPGCWSATPACGSPWRGRARSPPRPVAPSAATCCSGSSASTCCRRCSSVAGLRR